VPKTQGIVASVKQMKFAMGLLRHGKVPLPVPPHVAEGVKESRALFELVKEQGRDGALGIVQGERALSRLEHEHGGEHRDPYGPGSYPKPFLPGEDGDGEGDGGASGEQGASQP
jgi:hypothetical protein